MRTCVGCGDSGNRYGSYPGLLGDRVHLCPNCDPSRGGQAGELVAVGTSVPSVPTELDELRHLAAYYKRQAKSANTRRSYTSSLMVWRRWCWATGHHPMPGSELAVDDYVTALAAGGRKRSTIKRHLAALAWAHGALGHPDPTKAPAVAETLQGIAREHGTARRKVAPMTLAELRRVVALPVEVPNDRLADLRDAAILLVGWWGCLRRVELAELQVEDLVDVEDGLDLVLPRSKGDQEGAGVTVPLFYQGPGACPVLALRCWVMRADLTGGPVFRAVDRHGTVGVPFRDAVDPGRAIHRIIRRRVAAVGLDPARYGGHSLRRGWITESFRQGHPEWAVQRHSRHRDRRSLDEYIDEGTRRHALHPSRGLR